VLCKCAAGSAASVFEELENSSTAQAALHVRSDSEKFELMGLAIQSSAPEAAIALAAASACGGASPSQMLTLQESLQLNSDCAVLRPAAVREATMFLLTGDAGDAYTQLLSSRAVRAAVQQRRKLFLQDGAVATSSSDLFADIRASSACVQLLNSILDCGGPLAETDGSVAASIALRLEAPQLLQRIVSRMKLSAGAISESLGLGNEHGFGRGLTHLAATLENSADGALALFAARRSQLCGHRDRWGLAAADLVHNPSQPTTAAGECAARELPALPPQLPEPAQHPPRAEPGVSWPTAEVAPPGFGAARTCEIDELPAEDVYSNASAMGVFVRAYVLGRRPVIVRGAGLVDQGLQKLGKRLSREALLQMHGQHFVNTEDISYASESGPAAGQGFATIPLSEVVSSHIEAHAPASTNAASTLGCAVAGNCSSAPADFSMAHVFVRALTARGRFGRHGYLPIRDIFPEDPDWVSNASAGLLPLDGAGGTTSVFFHHPEAPEIRQFYLGGPHTGTSLHWHNAAYNYLAHGLKLWALLPPPQLLSSKMPVHKLFAQRFEQLERLREPKPPLPPLVCTQRAGDLILIPSQWTHATYNMRVSVGVAVEYIPYVEEYR